MSISSAEALPSQNQLPSADSITFFEQLVTNSASEKGTLTDSWNPGFNRKVGRCLSRSEKLGFA